jgi:hypothetical protein
MIRGDRVHTWAGDGVFLERFYNVLTKADTYIVRLDDGRTWLGRAEQVTRID